MKFLALKECPTANEGQVFEATEAAGNVLVLVGAARKMEDDEDEPKPARRRYHRRDMAAETS